MDIYTPYQFTSIRAYTHSYLHSWKSTVGFPTSGVGSPYFLMAFLPTQRVVTFYFFQLSSNSFVRLLMAMSFPLFGL